MMHQNYRKQNLPLRPGHFSKCLVIENSRFIEHIAAVGVKVVCKMFAFQEFWKTSFIFLVSSKCDKLIFLYFMY